MEILDVWRYSRQVVYARSISCQKDNSSQFDGKLISIPETEIDFFFNFFQGNSNGLATIDISPAYTGLTDFHPVIVGTLLAVSTYSGLILWLLLFLKNISRKKLSLSDTEFIPFLFSRGIEHCFYLIVMTVQRHHLFIWSVFSPKFLYLGMAVLVTNIFLSIFCIICDINVFKNE